MRDTKRACWIAALCLAAAPLMAQDAPEGLVGAWMMDEFTGGKVLDSSGNGLDGEASGEPGLVAGKYNGGLEFTGSDMVKVPHDPLLNLENFTLAAWVNIPGVSGAWQIIASKENRGPIGRNYGMFANINTGVVHYSFTTNNGWKSFDAATPVTDGEWHHVAATYDGNAFILYLNAEIDAQTAPGTKPDNHENALFIGGCDIGGYWMTGVIDEVALFDRALSADEIGGLMEGGLYSILSVDPNGKASEMWARLKNNR